MPCTDERPCKAPMLRWVHSKRCKELTKILITPVVQDDEDQDQQDLDDALNEAMGPAGQG